MSTRCAATATPSPTCSERRSRALSIGERRHDAIAGGEIAIRVNRLQTDMRGTGRKMRPQAAPAPLIPKFANEDAAI